MPAPVAQSFALPFRSCSWFRCPAPGRFALRASAHWAHASLRAFGVHAVQATCLSAACLRAGPIPGCSIIRTFLSVVLMVSLPRFGSLWAFGPSAHRAHASLRAFGHSKRSRAAGAGRPAPMARAVGAGTRLPRRERAHAAGPLPTGTRSMARQGQPQGAGRRVSCSRLLNHSRFPDGRAHGFAAPLRVALGLRPKCPQGTRFPARLSGARNARVACVRRKDGRCHSERSKGRDPLT